MPQISPGWKGTGIVLLLMPIFHAVVQATMNSGRIEEGMLAAYLLGLGFVIVSFFSRSDETRAILGLLAGFLLWGAIGELGHLLHGGHDGGHSGHGAAVGSAQWGLVILMCMGYFATIRPYSLGGAGGGGRQGLCVAMEFFLLVWFFHVVLLTAYYHPSVGVDSWVTHGIFWLCGALGVYCSKLLARTECLAKGIRTGVLVSCLLWTSFEVPMKWGWFSKPWLPMRFEILGGIALLFVVWILVPTDRSVPEANSDTAPS